jgi:hypothetical protein
MKLGNFKKENTNMKPFSLILCTIAASILFSSLTFGKQATKQMQFTSPDEAVKMLITSAKENDPKKLMEILGPEAEPIIESGDSVEDNKIREKFVKAYEEGNKLEKTSDTKYTLIVGKTDWAFPIPLMKNGNNWYFDTPAGKEEILNRRVGRNELATIQSMLAYVDAQREYYLNNHPKDKLPNYAKKILSSPNLRDGLYYPVKEGEPPSPLGKLYATASTEGYGKKQKTDAQNSYHGYYYKILTSQGKDAPNGAYDYVIDGRMVGGHALIAWPATYGNSGVMTFMVSHDGVVYQKNLGPDTKIKAPQIKVFNPDKTWQPVKDTTLKE